MPIKRPRSILKRTTITVPPDLLEAFDLASLKAGYVDRSEAIRQAMRMAMKGWAKFFK